MNESILIHSYFEVKHVTDKKQQLYSLAKTIFCEKGFKDTSISAITQAANMAVGTFYLYYTSKEQLFMEIFKEENVRLKRHCFDSLDLSQDPRVVIGQMVKLNQEGIRSNPILREWYDSESFRKVEKTYREENGIGALDFLFDGFLTLVQRWQSEGKMRADIDSRMIMIVFTAIVNIDANKDEIGLEYFPALIDLITDLVLKGLMVCSE